MSSQEYKDHDIVSVVMVVEEEGWEAPGQPRDFGGNLPPPPSPPIAGYCIGYVAGRDFSHKQPTPLFECMSVCESVSVCVHVGYVHSFLKKKTLNIE